MFDSRGLSTTGAGAGTPPTTSVPPAAPKAGRFGPDPNVHLFDRAAIIIKHLKAAAALAILVVAAMMYQTYTTVPLYRAQARIHIRIAPVSGGDHNLFNNARETLPALSIGGGFLVLDCRPLGMT